MREFDREAHHTLAKKAARESIVMLKNEEKPFQLLPLKENTRVAPVSYTHLHYMELTENEEAMFDMVKENFEKVIVLINSSSPMELGFLENEKVDAAMWIGGPGSVGLQGVANALCGEVNPSGRLVDTYAYDATSSPAYMNIGDFTYTGTEHENGGMLGGVAPYKFMNYQEGIYVGYRYYETAAQDGYINYEETVQYPFGYGLSYTTFEQKMGELSARCV